MMMHIRPHPRAEAPASRFESLLRAIGVHPIVAEQFWGDLVESYRKDVAREGSLRGAINAADEVLRSLPHLAWSIARDGGPAERARLAACVTGVALASSLAFGVAAMRKGPPARLMFGGRSVDKVVVNHRRGAQLPIVVVDAGGRRLDSVHVSYRWVAGAPLAVSRTGVVTCTEAGDAVVRAAAGQIAQQLMVQCRPVQNLEAMTSMNFFVGGPPQKLAFAAVGLDGRRVTELRGFLRVRDTTIARLSGVTVTPLRSGTTDILVDIGEATARIHIHVREVVRRLTGLDPHQRSVVVPVRLAPGDTVRFALPQGSYWLSYRPSDGAAARPTLIIDGACMHGDGGRAYRVPDFVSASYCRVQNTGGYVTLVQESGAAAIRGLLALQFVQEVR
jgi:hypothetical protein